MVRLRFSTVPVMIVSRYGHIRTSKLGVGLSGHQSHFTLFTSKTGGSDYVRMGLFASVYGNLLINVFVRGSSFSNQYIFVGK